MAPIFQTLGELSSWMQANPGVRIVDAGIPLSHYADTSTFGPEWDSQPSVRKVVGFIARNVASIPLHVYDRVSDDDRERVTDGPLAGVIRKPSQAPGLTPYRFWSAILIDGLLHDRWCVRKTRIDGQPALVRIPARLMRFHVDGFDQIDRVLIYSKTGKFTEHDPADFIIDVGYATSGGDGSSTLTPLQHLLQEQREAVEYRRAVWKRGARIPGVITREKPWPKDGAARERFRTEWGQYARDGGKAGGMPLLEDGMQVQELKAFSPHDTEDLEGRRLADIEVASAYHVAPELVGARQGNYSNIDAYRQMLYRDSLGPYIVGWEQAINHQLVPDLADAHTQYIEAHVDAKLRGSFEEQAKVLQASTGAPWLRRNEARARMNLPAIEGGDELVTPLNVVIGGQASPQDSGSQNENADRSVAVKVLDSGGVRLKAHAPQTYTTRAEDVLVSYFRRQRAVVLSLLGSKAGRDWWDAERWDRELTTDLLSLAVETAREVSAQTLSLLGFDPADYDEDRTLAFLRAVAESRAGMINAATRDRIDKALASDDEDDTPADVFDNSESQRAPAAAATLVTTFSAFATTEAAKQSAGDRATKTWRTRSQKPRAEHARMDGETVGVDEKFSNGADWPGDPVLGADGVAGCRCDVEVTVS